MTREEKQAVRTLIRHVDDLLTNMADAGDYENPETGEIRADVNAIEKSIAEVNGLVIGG